MVFISISGYKGPGVGGGRTLFHNAIFPEVLADPLPVEHLSPFIGLHPEGGLPIGKSGKESPHGAGQVPADEISAGAGIQQFAGGIIIVDEEEGKSLFAPLFRHEIDQALNGVELVHLALSGNSFGPVLGVHDGHFTILTGIGAILNGFGRRLTGAQYPYQNRKNGPFHVLSSFSSATTRR